VKKLLIALATTVALVGPAAHAGSPTKAGQLTIPAEYRGQWCKRDTGYYVPRKHMAPSECDADYMITLKARSIEFEDGACKLTRIESAYFDKVNLPKGVFACEGDQIPFVFTTGSGSLGHLARRLYLEELKPAEPAVPPQSSAYQCPTTLPICAVGNLNKR
jgi:hypothetical protein